MKTRKRKKSGQQVDRSCLDSSEDEDNGKDEEAVSRTPQAGRRSGRLKSKEEKRTPKIPDRKAVLQQISPDHLTATATSRLKKCTPKRLVNNFVRGLVSLYSPSIQDFNKVYENIKRLHSFFKFSSALLR